MTMGADFNKAMARPWCVVGDDIWSGEDGNPGVPLFHVDRGADRTWGARRDCSEIEATTAFVVHAANCHGDLVKALSLIVRVYEKNCIAEGEPSSVLDACREALAKAEAT
jgi:hypothetical protein